MRILAVLEGPIASDGNDYYHGKGEGLYLDNIAKNITELTLITYVFKPQHKDYATACQYKFQANNIKVIELPFNPDKKYSPVQKTIHFWNVFKIINKAKGQGELYYLFIPSYPSAILWLINLLNKQSYIVYSASDWVELSENLFKWHDSIYKYLFKSVVTINGFLERNIAKKAVFCLTAGHALHNKFKHFNKYTYLTIPRISLTEQDIYYRNNTCINQNIRIITVGDLIPRKNLPYLLKGILKYKKLCHKDISVDIVGIGPCENELRKIAAKKGIEKNINFVGYIKDSDKLNELYRKADIYVLTSKSEGFPRVLYEAMSQGLPIITSDCGGITGLIENYVNGIVIDINDDNALPDALCKLIDNNKLRQKIIRNGYKTITEILKNSDPKQVINLISRHCCNRN